MEVTRPLPGAGAAADALMSSQPHHDPDPTPPPTSSADRIDRELDPQVYAELKRLAAFHLQRERVDHTLQPTALVHEAFLKLAGRTQAADHAAQSQGQSQGQSQSEFRALASHAMRQILVDHARKRNTDKRGGSWLRITLDDAVGADHERELDLLALDEAMEGLAKLDARKCRVVELRFFGGLTCEEAAKELRISPKTAEADWYMARAWLRSRLTSAG
jgi:RNA polymerase sigma-70 factor, ECF subfamily